MCNDVKKEKNNLLANETIWSRLGKFEEKSQFVYSELERLIDARERKRKSENKIRNRF